MLERKFIIKIIVISPQKYELINQDIMRSYLRLTFFPFKNMNSKIKEILIIFKLYWVRKVNSFRKTL